MTHVFMAMIPDSRKAFEIPGSKQEARLTLMLDESQVPKALPLILLRGELFDMTLKVVMPIPVEKQQEGKSNYRAVGKSITTLCTIASKDNAIRISGRNGMSIVFAIPSIDSTLLVRLLDFRDQLLRITIPERRRHATKENHQDNHKKTQPAPHTHK